MQACRPIGGIGTLVAWLVMTGCGTQPRQLDNSPPRPEPAEALRKPSQAESIPPPVTAERAALPADVSPAPTAVNRLSPEKATITAEDPGLQLRLDRVFPEGAVSDLTSRASWKLEPSTIATLDALSTRYASSPAVDELRRKACV